MSDLFTAHSQLITNLASQYFPIKEDQEDAIQEVWFKLADMSFINVKNEGALVYRIVSNLFKDLYNKDKRIKELDQYAGVMEDIDENDPLSITLAVADDDEYSRRLQDMPLDLAHTATLYYTGGLSYKEIADELSIPEGTVASRLNKARKYFRGEDF